MKYSIVLPVHNQALHIGPIVDDYCKALDQGGWSYELILVVNGSSDRSSEICRQLSKRFPSVKVIDTPQKGWGMAVRLGLKEAKGEVICYTNSSRTQVSDLMQFLKCADQNPDHVIKANRKIRENWRRRLGSLLYNVECRTLFDLNFWDINGTPKIFPRKYEKLLELSRNDDLIDLEFLVLCRKNNYPILEVPVFSFKRLGGKSTTNYHSAFKLYMGAFELWRENRKKIIR